MALDQNSIPKDLRPLNFTRKIVNEPHVVARHLEGASVVQDSSGQDVSSPRSRTANGAADGSGAFGYVNSMGVRCPVRYRGGGNTAEPSSEFHLYGQSDGGYRHPLDPQQGAIPASGSQDCLGGDVNDDLTFKKVKLLCSFGGRILPRPSDGMLRYVGGQTRIIGVKRDISYQELMQKMIDTCGQPVIIKYQLPDEDLDALVSVSSVEDLENMMEEYEKLLEGSSEGSSKLRVFLFSASELDPSGIASFGNIQDNGQRYVDAVNGIPENTIRRKDSTASASTQNSDGCLGGDVAESLLPGQGDGEVTSPSYRVAASSHDASRVIYMAPNSQMMFTEAAMPPNIHPILTTCPPQLLPVSQPDLHSQFYCESDLDRPIPPTAVLHPGQSFVTSMIGKDEDSPTKWRNHQAMDFRPEGKSLATELRPSVVDLHPAAGFVKTFADGSQDSYSHADYLQNASQFAYSSSQSLVQPGPVYLRAGHPQQTRDNVVGMLSNPFTSVLRPGYIMSASPTLQQINATSPSPRVNVTQIHVDPFLEENPYGPRFPVPNDQNYKPLQLQPLTHLQGPAVERYAWHQALLPEHLISPEQWVAQQPGVFPEKAPKLEDCYMCQKSLPHAHSDTLLQEQRSNVSNTVSGANLGVQSFHSDGSLIRCRHLPQATGTLLEGGVEHQTTRPIGYNDHLMDNEIAAPMLGSYRFPQNLEETHGSERILTQKVEKPDQSRLLFPQGVIGLPDDLQSSYLFPGNPPQSCQDVFQPFAKSQYQVKQDVIMSKPVGIDVSSVRNVPPISTADPTVRDLATEYVGKYPGFIPQDVSNTFIACDHLRAIDGRLEAFSIGPSEISEVNEEYQPPPKLNSNSSKEEKLENVTDTGMRRPESFLISNTKKIPGIGTHLDAHLLKPGIVMDECYKELDSFPCSSSAGPSFLNIPPVDPRQAVPGIHGPFLDLRVGGEPLISDSLWNTKPAVSCIDATYSTMADRNVEWKDEASYFHSRSVLNDTAAPLNGRVPFPLSNIGTGEGPNGDNWDSTPVNVPSSGLDPQNILRDMHVPPNVVATKEIFDPKCSYGDNHLSSCANMSKKVGHPPSDELDVSKNNDLCSEPFGSIKDSADSRIKQELQAVAEGVAAAVLGSSIDPGYICSSSHDFNGPQIETDQEEDVYGNDMESDSAIPHAGLRIEEMNTKMLEKVNPGSPISDGISRLQIIKNSDLEELRELGSGTFGTVYHGKWRGTDVAIKRINDRCFAGKPSEQERLRADFWNEACKLADLHHPNVVAFYGVVLDGPGGSVATVTEFMVNGSLRHALQKNDRILDRRKRLLIAMDVAFGMEYLHGKNIVHFDLKSDNLLVNLRDPQRPICKVGDLGLSKVKCQTLISGGVRGTLPWMAPELLNGSSSLVSEKVDVFSYGIVMWEIVSGEEPYADLHYGAIIGGIVSNTLRPPVPESCEADWRWLMERCWSAEPSERPSFTEIANELRSMAASLPPKGQQAQQSTK